VRGGLSKVDAKSLAQIICVLAILENTPEYQKRPFLRLLFNLLEIKPIPNKVMF
jgi:hypothetical protein